MTGPGSGGAASGHTFLFTEAAWRAEGTYLVPEGETLPASGRTVVTHADGVWINDGTLRVEAPDGPGEIRSVYRIEPFGPGERSTSWTAENPVLGELRGTFAVVGDTILSVYRSADGGASGSESLRRVDDDSYENRGLLRAADGEVSAWDMRLTRVG